MTFLRTRRTFGQRLEAAQKAGELFLQEAPKGFDDSRSKVGVSIGKGGCMRPVSVFYKKPPKELGLEFLHSNAVRIV